MTGLSTHHTLLFFVAELDDEFVLELSSSADAVEAWAAFADVAAEDCRCSGAFALSRMAAVFLLLCS